MKRPLIYLGIAILVALAIFLFENPQGSRVEDSSAESFIPGFDSTKVANVEIEQLMDGASIKKNGEKWEVAERISSSKEELLKKEGLSKPEPKWWLADRTRVTSALGAFGGLERGILVSDNPEKQSLYQVDDVTGLKVRATGADGASIIDVVIGKGGPDFGSTYLRRTGENNVYLIHRPIVGAFSPRAKDWRERKLWSIEPSEIHEVEVASPKTSWKISKDGDGKWQGTLPDGKPADDESVNALVGKIAHVSSVDFADDAADKGSSFDKPTAILSLKYGGEKKVKLTIGKMVALSGERDKSTGRYHAKLDESDEVHVLSQEVMDLIQPHSP